MVLVFSPARERFRGPQWVQECLWQFWLVWNDGVRSQVSILILNNGIMSPLETHLAPTFTIIILMLNYCNSDSNSLKPVKNGKHSRRKSCLCWAPDVIFNDKEDSESTEVFPEHIQIRMDAYQSFIETSVSCQLLSNICQWMESNCSIQSLGHFPVWEGDYRLSYFRHGLLCLFSVLVSELPWLRLSFSVTDAVTCRCGQNSRLSLSWEETQLYWHHWDWMFCITTE